MKILIFGAIAALLARAKKWTTAGNADSTDGPPPIEVGTFAMTTGGKWESVTFSGSFSEAPVVVVMPTTEGSNPCTIYIKDVTATGFKAAPAEPYQKDGPHPSWSPETISYIAVAAGTWELGGKKFVAGKMDTKTQKYNDDKTTAMTGDGGWDSVAFGNGDDFSTIPALLTQIQTTNNNADFTATTYAEPFLTVACQSVSTHAASLALERLEVANYGTVTEDETIGWIAIETGTGFFVAPSGSIVNFSSLYTDRVFRGWDNSAESVNLGLAGGFSTDSPLVIASQNSRNGNNGGWLRLKSRSETSASLVVDEDDKVDSERSHVQERAGIFAVSAEFCKPTTTTTTTTKSWQRMDPASCVEVAMIETRQHGGIVPPLEGFAQKEMVDGHLFPGCGTAEPCREVLLTLVHGSLNQAYVSQAVDQSAILAAAKKAGHLRLLSLNVPDIGGDGIVTDWNKQLAGYIKKRSNATVTYHDEYSRLLESPALWHKLRCEHVLVMQSDSLICQNSEFHLQQFLNEEYIGGETPGLKKGARLHLNGGFSFRNRHSMMKCIQSHPLVPGEDTFFSTCPLLKQPTQQMVDQFAIDNAHKPVAAVPFGMHKPWGAGLHAAQNIQKCVGAAELQPSNR